MNLMLAVALALFAVTAATVFHFEALERLGRTAERRGRIRHASAIGIVVSLVLAHVAEILFFACAFGLGAGPLQIGGLDSPAAQPDVLAYVYFSAETYSTLGFGDIRPTGELRLLAGVEAVAGLLLLAWSGAFLFALVQRAAQARP